jgi:1-deoxy-D-xylulose-5-phosphate synthase
MRFAKPLDTELLAEIIKTHDAIITIEEGSRNGFGASVMEYACNAGLFDDKPLKMRSLTLPDHYQDQDSQPNQYAEAGLDCAAILAAVEALRS